MNGILEFPIISSICLVSLRAKPLITTVKICMKYCSYFSATHQLNELLVNGELHPFGNYVPILILLLYFKFSISRIY